MGIKMGPSYACLFMGYLETQIQNTSQDPQPEHYYRYIDDGIGITTLSKEELNSY